MDFDRDCRTVFFSRQRVQHLSLASVARFFFGMAAATHTTAPGGLESYRQYEAKIYMKDPSSVERYSVLFTVKNRVGALDDCLRTFRKFNLSLTKIESRPSRVCHVFYCHMFPVAVRSEANM